MVDERASLSHRGILTQAKRRQLKRKILASLKSDRAACARKVGEAVTQLLLDNEVEEAWRTIKGWYRAVEEKAPKPCYLTMLNQIFYSLTFERPSIQWIGSVASRFFKDTG